MKVNLRFISETPKARRYSKVPPTRHPTEDDMVWIPKSIIEHTSKNVNNHHVVTLPDWFVENGGGAMIDVEGSVRAVSLDEAQARHDSLFLITCQIVKAAGGRVNIPVHARSVLNPTLTVSQLSDGSLEVTVRDVK